MQIKDLQKIHKMLYNLLYIGQRLVVQRIHNTSK